MAADYFEFREACVAFFPQIFTVKQACCPEPHTNIHTVTMPPWMQGGVPAYV